MLKLEYELMVCVGGRSRTAKVTGEFTPGRPPPPCSNPDSPAFSDSGDPPEANIQSVVDVATNESFDLDALTDDESEDLMEAFIDRAENDPKIWGALAEPDFIPEDGGEDEP